METSQKTICNASDTVSINAASLTLALGFLFSDTQKLIYMYVLPCKSKPFALAVDIGCGTGQGSRPLAPYIDKVIGIDRSQAQLENARVQQNASNIEYRLGSAENVPLPDACDDVITCAMAVQWVNFEEFNKEVDRVLKPGGCVAVYGDDYCNRLIAPDKAIEDELNKSCYKFGNGEGPGKLESCSNYSHQHLKNNYAEFAIPYKENKRMNEFMVIDREISVTEYMGYIRSQSKYWTYLQRYPDLPDPVDEYEKKVMSILKAETTPEETFITRREVIFLFLGRKPL